MTRQIWTIFKKEVVDNLRDRRTLTSSLITPIIIPLFLVAMIIVLGQTMNGGDTDAKPLQVPIQGAENAPGLVSFLKQQGAIILPAPADARTEVREGNLDFVLVIPPGYGEDFTAGNPAKVQVILDTSRTSANITQSRMRSLLQGYNQSIGALRLQARGIDPNIVNPLMIEPIDIATPQSQTLIFLNMLPFLLVMTIFMGGMYVIIDATAGERERGSLEALLINPATRADFAIGKLLASLPFAIFTLIVALASIGIAFNVIPLEKYIGFPMSISITSLLTIFWLTLPLVLLASSLQMIIATFTRSFKEAQTYLGFLPLVAGFPIAFLAFLPVKATFSKIVVPVLGQSILINQVMRGETVLPMNIILSAAVTIAISIILAGVSVKLYQREQILYGR